MEIILLILVLAKKIGSIAALVHAGIAARLFTFSTFRFVKFTHRPNKRVAFISKSTFHCFVFFSIVEITSSIVTVNYGETLELAYAGMICGGIAGISSMLFWMVMVAHDLHWRRNVERDAKRYIMRTLIGLMIFGMFACTFFAGSNVEKIAIVRSWEFLLLSFGICIPFIAGKEFVRISLQLRQLFT
ncbi:hypothetical protein [Azospirillum melinis]